MLRNSLLNLRKQWDRLGRNEKILISALTALDGAAKSAALASLARTPKEQVRGPKLLWGPIIASVNTFGWIAWFIFGTTKKKSAKKN
ncbi:PLDc N-terminal domain-containing protein [Corynebacterium mayonis]|uniref:PLDc N-terminal domain-containing protein n=1 Tax=Corynebacterium mayonis TaxID=3062461 RepID=UPI00314023DC